MKKTVVLRLFLPAVMVFYGTGFAQTSEINRSELVRRHNPELDRVDFLSPFTVGNGEFAFTADVTGLQSFPDEYYANGIPLETLSNWAWHSMPNPDGFQLKDAYEFVDTHGRLIGYPTRQDSPAGKWLRANPHRMPLGQTGFLFTTGDGTPATIDDIQDIRQNLDLWTGALNSACSLEGDSVQVTTVCHPRLDAIAVRVKSPLIVKGRLRVVFAFPYSYALSVKNKPPLDWSHPDLHRTDILSRNRHRVVLSRKVDSTRYTVSIGWCGNAVLEQMAPHRYLMIPPLSAPAFEFTMLFAKSRGDAEIPDVRSTLSASRRSWENFWNSGGAMDFSECTDPRAFELERRIVLSQYLTRIQSAGSLPPQESGLTHISWYGKHHTEMAWWHTAHFALWGRMELLENSLAWFRKILPDAVQATKQERGLPGVRWSKMVGPEGRESPGGNPFIIWNQPHPIYLAELCYRANPTLETLQRYKEVVFASAEYMGAFAFREKGSRRYVLGPPVWLAQEIYDPKTAQNPSFELAYWAFGLKLAQKWRQRLGLPANPEWDRIAANLTPLPMSAGLYVGLESTPDTFTNPESMRDHPSMLMACGFLPGEGLDKDAMRRTLDRVLEGWRWDAKIWGWDYPMIAITAARLGEPEKAVDILLADLPHNHYLKNGHCPGTPDLPVYLPTNGALLAAAAMMAAGWDGNPQGNAPGFPKNGKWNVRWEGLMKLP